METRKKLDYGEEKFLRVSVCGIECAFSDMRIDRNTVPAGKYHYEVASDDVLWLKEEKRA